MNRPALAALAVLALLIAPGARADGSGGPVWVLKGSGGGTVYLAGSVHALDATRSALPAAFEIAYRDAERLVMEIDFDDLDETAIAAFMASHAVFDGEETLRTVLGPGRFERLDREARALGLPLDSVATLEPWAVAITLTQLQLARMGLDPAKGVEQQFVARARADAKPITGLETVEDQLGALDGLSYADQARFLELTIDDIDRMPAELERMLAAWQRADLATLEGMLLDEYERFPALFTPLVDARNRLWLPQIEALLERSDDTLVIVGALHLVGRDGLLAMLERAGVTPLPPLKGGIKGG